MQCAERIIKKLSKISNNMSESNKSIGLSVAFTTLGCKVNYYETEKMMKDFMDYGFKIVKYNEYADVYVVNTCSVTNEADRKSRKLMRRPKKINPDAIVVVTGCYAQSGKEVLEKDEEIDYVCANDEKDKIASLIYNECMKRDVSCIDEGMYENRPFQMEDGRVRKYIKIQDGCNQFCTYCLIPFVRGRGRLRSVAADEVYCEVEEVASQGYKEIVLTGIHISSYGIEKGDFNEFVRREGKPLSSLINKIDEIPGIERIRISSLEPRIISDVFLEDLCKAKKITPHFHLSLQSGSQTVLDRMNRHYTVDEYAEACNLIRKHFKYPAITTDIIVGFPGETEEEFEETLEFVKKVKLTGIHVFPYSRREGTRADKFPNQVDPQVKAERVKRLIELNNELTREYEEGFVGQDELVLWEEEKVIDDKVLILGHNERYVKFAVSSEQAQEEGICRNTITTLNVKEENIFININ